jgi:hypothetical protein
MHFRGSSKALFLAMIVLIAGLLAGCGSGNDQSGSGSQQDSGAKEKKAKNAPEKNAPEKKIALGTVSFVNPKTERFTVRPSTEQQGKKRLVFKLAKKSKVTLGGKEAKLEDMKKGQQAQVEYVVGNDNYRARSVMLFESGDSGDDQGGEKTD